jgi:hypothetical protein
LWSFFGSSHGNGPHDKVGTIVKKFVKQSQLNVQGPQLQNAEQVVMFFLENLSQ